jgi:hypothetical protein
MTAGLRPLDAHAATSARAGGGDVGATRHAESPRFVWIVLVLYTALVSTVSAFHEAWKDETQAWRLAIDSHGLRELVQNSRFEGHPLLFHLMVQALGHISRSWWALATLHVIIAAVAAWLVLRYAPFTRVQKVLLVFGYWTAYEYAVVVRPYGLGMMLAFAACIAWSARPRRIGWATLFLVLLANTTPIGMLLAMTLAFAFAVDWAWPDEGRPRPSRRVVWVGGFAALVATVAVLSVTAARLKTAADAVSKVTPGAAAGVSKWDLALIPTTELRALVPVVRASSEGVHWNHWFLLPESSGALAALLLASLAAIALGCILALRRRVALLVFVVGTAGYLLFFGFVFHGAAHLHGYLFVVWVLSAWLAWADAPSRWPATLQRWSEHFEADRSRVFTLSLVLPVLAMLELAWGDVVGPFADSRQVADVIRSHGLANAPIVAVGGRSEAQAVAAFLDRPVLYPVEGKRSTFVVWGGTSGYRRTVRAADSAVTALLTRECEVVVLSSPAKDVSSGIASRARVLYTTPRLPMSDDRYRVWLAKAPPSPRCPARAG